MRKSNLPFSTMFEQDVAFDKGPTPFANIPVDLDSFGCVRLGDCVKRNGYPRDIAADMGFKIANLIVKLDLRFLHLLPVFTPSLTGELSRLWIRVFDPARIGH